MLDAGCWMLMLGAGCWVQAAGCRLLRLLRPDPITYRQFGKLFRADLLGWRAACTNLNWRSRHQALSSSFCFDSASFRTGRGTENACDRHLVVCLGQRMAIPWNFFDRSLAPSYRNPFARGETKLVVPRSFVCVSL